MLPLVGSTITDRPGPTSPSSSAASIIATPIRSLTEPPGLKYSSFAQTSAPRPSREAPQRDQRRLAHDSGSLGPDSHSEDPSSILRRGVGDASAGSGLICDGSGGSRRLRRDGAPPGERGGLQSDGPCTARRESPMPCESLGGVHGDGAQFNVPKDARNSNTHQERRSGQVYDPAHPICSGNTMEVATRDQRRGLPTNTKSTTP